jgi:hypothetical protein
LIKVKTSPADQIVEILLLGKTRAPLFSSHFYKLDEIVSGYFILVSDNLLVNFTQQLLALIVEVSIAYVIKFKIVFGELQCLGIATVA